MPHQRASKLLDELTDASMSDSVIHQVLQQTGSLDVLQVCPDAADIQDRIAQAAAGRKWRPNSATPAPKPADVGRLRLSSGPIRDSA